MLNIYWVDEPDINLYSFCIDGNRKASIVLNERGYVFSGYMPEGYYETCRELNSTDIEDAKSEFLKIYKDELAKSIESMKITIEYNKELLNQL